MSKSKEKIKNLSAIESSAIDDAFYQEFGFFDPKFDIVFKFLFGREASANLLKIFLNDLCEYFRVDPIVSLQILDPFNLKNFKSDKLSIVDIKVKTTKGIYINVEIQRAENEFYIARSHYYADNLYIHQLKAKENFSTLKEVICLHILDFVLFPNEEDMLNTYRFKNIRSGKDLDPVMKELNFLELPKVGSFLQSAKQWKELFCPKSRESLSKLCEKNEAIMSAVNELNIFSMDPKARKAYFDRRLAEMDRQSILETAERRGERKGERRGREIGKEIGKEIGIGQTLRVIKLFQKGFSEEEISKELDYPSDEVQSILKQFQA